MSYQKQLQLAISAMQAGQLPAAAQAANIVLQLQPEQPDALHILALVARQQQNHAIALQLFVRSLAANAKQPVVWANYANLLAFMQQLDQAEQAYQQALKLAPNFADAWSNAAKLALQRHHLPLAQSRIAQAQKLAPTTVKFMLQQAEIHTAAGLLAQAMQVYEQALALDPHNFHGWYNKGSLLRQLNQPAAALQCFDRIADQGKSSPEYHFNRACAAAEHGDFGQAEQYWHAAIELKPDYIEAHLSLNNYYWEHQLSSKFLQSFAQSLQRQPNSVPLIYQYAGRLIQSGQQAQAEQVLRDGLQRVGQHPELLHALGVQLSKQGDLNQAQQLTRQALQQQPNHSRFRIDLANYLMREGDYQQALNELAQAQRLEPDNQEIWAYQGTCWRLTDDPKSAWLNNYTQLVREIQLGTPAGYDNQQHFLTELNLAITALHVSRQQPLDQSVRGGTQTIGSLLAEPAPVIQAYRQLLQGHIKQYLTSLPTDNSHPLLRRNQQQFSIVGSWSVRLQQAGFHTNHVHPLGWLSACTYLDIPAAIQPSDPDKAGWLKLGETSLDLGAREQVAKAICPTPGLLVLFPSYIWHGTYPFSGEGHRLTAPCDISPRQ